MTTTVIPTTISAAILQELDVAFCCQHNIDGFDLKSMSDEERAPILIANTFPIDDVDVEVIVDAYVSRYSQYQALHASYLPGGVADALSAWETNEFRSLVRSMRYHPSYEVRETDEVYLPYSFWSQWYHSAVRLLSLAVSSDVANVAPILFQRLNCSLFSNDTLSSKTVSELFGLSIDLSCVPDFSERSTNPFSEYFWRDRMASIPYRTTPESVGLSINCYTREEFLDASMVDVAEHITEALSALAEDEDEPVPGYEPDDTVSNLIEWCDDVLAWRSGDGSSLESMISGLHHIVKCTRRIAFELDSFVSCVIVTYDFDDLFWFDIYSDGGYANRSLEDTFSRHSDEMPSFMASCCDAIHSKLCTIQDRLHRTNVCKLLSAPNFDGPIDHYSSFPVVDRKPLCLNVGISRWADPYDDALTRPAMDLKKFVPLPRPMSAILTLSRALHSEG